MPPEPDPEYSTSPVPVDEDEEKAVHGMPHGRHGANDHTISDLDHPLPPNEIPDGWLFRRAG
jgi:hypothetical protein